MGFIRSLICRIRGRHRVEVALDPSSGYYNVCANCRHISLLMGFE